MSAEILDPRLPMRLQTKISLDRDKGCWLWVSEITNTGYGRVRWNGRKLVAHRVVYEQLVGPIPPNLDLDHLCRVRRCVNPEHLAPVTHRENVLRGIGVTATNARKTSCKNGHPFDEANTHRVPTGRSCAECERTYKREWIRAKRAAAVGAKP